MSTLNLLKIALDLTTEGYQSGYDYSEDRSTPEKVVVDVSWQSDEDGDDEYRSAELVLTEVNGKVLAKIVKDVGEDMATFSHSDNVWTHIDEWVGTFTHNC